MLKETLRVTLKDLKTGEVKEYPATDLTVWDWTESNWSCDCNRIIAFKGECDWGAPCETVRYIVVDVEGDTEHLSKQEFIDECNSEYSVKRRITDG